LLDPEELTRLYEGSQTLPPETVSAFQKQIYSRYHSTPRPMPWRTTGDPYHILTAEVMLQQTQVERVKTKYAQFLAAFPTINALASAPLADVLQVWQGLGYNRRAIALKRCAEEIISRFDGHFPPDIGELESLPGIGPYSARAVAAFAFGMAEPFIETNIRTLFIHFFFHGRDKVCDRQIMPLVSLTLDRQNPRDWYYALMDFGVWLKQVHPNPGRRSRHHQQQSRFEGSNRQLRSRLLRAIMEHPEVTGIELAQRLEAPPDVVERNLLDMEREGFLYRSDGRYSVPGSKKG